MDPHELLMTALRAVAVYILMLVVIRLLGKRTVGNFTAFDLLVALMLGEVVDEIIYGDVSFAQGTVAILVVALAKYLTAWLSYFDHGLNRILEGAPTPVIRNGEFQKQGLRSEIMNEKEVMAALRLAGVDDLREVRLACVEVDGEVSVIREDWAEAVQKGDVLSKEKKEKAESASGKDEPPGSKQTDSEGALGQE